MSHRAVADEAPELPDTTSGVLLRLWDDLEQMLTVPRPAPRAVVSPRGGTMPLPRQEAPEVMPTRVRYAFD